MVVDNVPVVFRLTEGDIEFRKRKHLEVFQNEGIREEIVI